MRRVLVFVMCALFVAMCVFAADRPPKTSAAWTFDEAVARLRLDPNDVYLQYVVLQLGRQMDRLDDARHALEGDRPSWATRNDRRANMFDLFTGAAAVQESLQLETMAGDGRRPRTQPGVKPAPVKESSDEPVAVKTLKGPGVKSHPWETMLAGKKVKISPLEMCVPSDQFFVLFRSLSKMVELNETGDLWGSHLFSAASHSAVSRNVGERLKKQLAVRTDPLTRPFYDMVVEQVALTGSDLYFREGTDVTILFALKQAPVFRLRMDGFLAEAVKAGAKKSTGKLLGVDFEHLATADRSVCVYSAYPRPDLHVRSNSKVGLERVLAAIAGKNAEGDKVERLGESLEYQYVRTLLPSGAPEEDVWVYLSDPLIRRIVGPEVKLTELHRMRCYNNLRMIAHASLLFRTQYGRAPQSFAELASTECSPGLFNAEKLKCPDGGSYQLLPDGSLGECSCHGRADWLTPCCEIPVKEVSPDEARDYQNFVVEYNRYWRQYFDPIALRVRVSPKEYRVETLILPLIDNSVYTGMAMAFGGEPKPLDVLPLPQRNIFSLAMRLNKDKMPLDDNAFRFFLDYPARSYPGLPDGKAVNYVIRKGLGDVISFHVYDSTPVFEVNFSQLVGDSMSTFRGGVGRWSGEFSWVAFLIASLNAPVYIAAPVQDPAIVDTFLNQLDVGLANLARRPMRDFFFEVNYDFSKFNVGGVKEPVRCFGFGVGPIKWRFYFARIDNALVLASKSFVLTDLAAASAKHRVDAGAGTKSDPMPTANAMFRIRPEHWEAALPEMLFGWEESNRRACHNNLSPLSSAARALAASGKPAMAAEGRTLAESMHAAEFYCPDGGKYELAPDGKQFVCSVHQTPANPRQLAIPAESSALARLGKELKSVVAALTFLEDGLHAVVTIEREPKK